MYSSIKDCGPDEGECKLLVGNEGFCLNSFVDLDKTTPIILPENTLFEIEDKKHFLRHSTIPPNKAGKCQDKIVSNSVQFFLCIYFQKFQFKQKVLKLTQ